MKTKTLEVFCILIFLLVSTTVYGQSQLFSGEWKFNREKSTNIDNRLFLAKITVLQKSDSIFTTRVYENDYGEQYPFEENLPLNGKECKIVIYDMPRTSKASFPSGSDALNLESITAFTGNYGPDSLKTRETWHIEDGGKLLKVDYKSSYSGGSAAGTQYFDKVK